MNNLIKLALVALFTFSVTACNVTKEQSKAEFTKIQQLDNEFVATVNSNTDRSKFIPILKAAEQKYSALNIKSSDIKAFRDKSVAILKDTVSLAELSGNIKTEEDKKAFLAKRESLVKQGNELKVMKAELVKKYTAEEAPATAAEK